MCRLAAWSTRATVAGTTRSARITRTTWATWATWTTWTARATWRTRIARVVHVSGAIVAAADHAASDWIRFFAHRDELEFASKLRGATAGARFGQTAWSALALGSWTVVLQAIAPGALAVAVQDAAAQFTALAATRPTRATGATWAARTAARIAAWIAARTTLKQKGSKL